MYINSYILCFIRRGRGGGMDVDQLLHQIQHVCEGLVGVGMGGVMYGKYIVTSV